MKRARLDAVPAADASFPAVFHDPVLPSVESSCRAGRHTSGIVTVETGGRNGSFIAIGKPPKSKTFHAPQPDPRRSVVLQLAAYFTGVTANALPVIKKNQLIIHHNAP
ncbi:MAG TPA: hypothetical protein VMJ66_17675 [Geobacteraceae bacterium]|nr:hypothetical protein [Geobacteraceae bacterium]